MFSDYNEIKIEIDENKIFRKAWISESKQHFLNNISIEVDITREIGKYEMNGNENTAFQS